MEKKDLSISMLSANLLSLAFAIPLAIVLAWIFILRWGYPQLLGGINAFFGNLIVFLVIFIIGIVIHELIHGISWALFAKIPFSAIKFGFQVQTLTPYAHCARPVPVNAYRAGTFMPALILGILPAIVAIIDGSGWLFSLGLIFTISAGGDMVILWILRIVAPEKLVEDHPSRAGCYVLE